MDAKVKAVGNVVAAHMNHIAELFNDGVKLTVLVRTSDDPEGDLLITNDDPDKIINAIAQSKSREGVQTETPQETLSRRLGL